MDVGVIVALSLFGLVALIPVLMGIVTVVNVVSGGYENQAEDRD